MDTSINNRFCDIDNTYSDKNKSQFQVLPIPYEATISYRSGTNLGPEAIINASVNMELYDEELKQETYKKGIHTLPFLEPKLKNHKKIISELSGYCSNLTEENKTLFSLGGEHSISIGIVDAFYKKYQNLSVLYLDAHADLRNSYRNNPLSHACSARRIHESTPIVSVGTRSLSVEEAEFINKNNMNIFWGKSAITSLDKILDILSETVYISIDVDIMDPSIMPSTGTPEPDGWLWNELTKFLKDIIFNKKIVGIDLVELAPIKNNPAPDFTIAKLIYRLIGYLTVSKLNT